MANPGHPSIGLGYLFYLILRAISYISGESKTRKKKYGKIVLPATLFFMIFILVFFLLIMYI